MSVKPLLRIVWAALAVSCAESGGDGSESHFVACHTDATCASLGPGYVCADGRCRAADDAGPLPDASPTGSGGSMPATGGAVGTGGAGGLMAGGVSSSGTGGAESPFDAATSGCEDGGSGVSVGGPPFTGTVSDTPAAEFVVVADEGDPAFQMRIVSSRLGGDDSGSGGSPSSAIANNRWWAEIMNTGDRIVCPTRIEATFHDSGGQFLGRIFAEKNSNQIEGPEYLTSPTESYTCLGKNEHGVLLARSGEANQFSFPLTMLARTEITVEHREVKCPAPVPHAFDVTFGPVTPVGASYGMDGTLVARSPLQNTMLRFYPVDDRGLLDLIDFPLSASQSASFGVGVQQPGWTWHFSVTNPRPFERVLWFGYTNWYVALGN